MPLKGLSIAEAQRQLRGKTITLDKDMLARLNRQLLGLLEWQDATQVELLVQDCVVPGNKREYWAGSEGFVFGIDVHVDKQPKAEQCGGRLLLKVLSDEVIKTQHEGELRKRRAEFLCSPAMNLHLRLLMHNVEDRDLFAGAPILSFTHTLGLGDGSCEYICYVMKNAGASDSYRGVAQWAELREERILSGRERLWLAHDLARCVGIMEELALVHGDLSPENVLVLIPEAASGRPKISLVDFDLFYARNADCPVLPVHRPDGGAPGHNGYLPPPDLILHDVEKDWENVGTVRYDRFALGLLIFEFLGWCCSTGGLPLILQNRIDRLDPQGDGRRLLGNMRFTLGTPMQELLGRVLSLNYAGWPSPQEWVGALEARDVYRICPNPARSDYASERRACACAWPAPEAFAESVRGRPVADGRRLAGESAMRKVFGHWMFKPAFSAKRAAVKETFGERSAQALRECALFWKIPALWPVVHFRWMAENPVQAEASLDRHRQNLPACPVCGGALTIADEVKG